MSTKREKVLKVKMLLRLVVYRSIYGKYFSTYSRCLAYLSVGFTPVASNRTTKSNPRVPIVFE